VNVHLAFLGCRLNEAERASWSRQLRAGGHAVVAHPAAAHVIVLNTCAVTAQAARKSRQAAARLHRRAPQARLVLTGCMSALEPERAAALAGVDLVVPNTGKDALVERLQELDGPGLPALAQEPGGQHLFAEERTRAFVKIQDGCRHRCTFCTVTVARGPERSRTVDELVGEVAALHASGFAEVVLTGVHIGGYGRDVGADLRWLLAALLTRTTIPRIRVGSLEPWGLPPGLLELWADGRLQPHLHLPVQSGADSVLRRMGRRCTADGYRALVARARSVVPDLSVTTDLIVGFPGETDAEFEDSLALMDDLRFAHVHLFTYSARAGTPAARLPGHLPSRVKRARAQRAAERAERHRLEARRAAIGGVRPVLWERSPEVGRWTGLTDHYLRVETRSAASLRGTITPTRLVGLATDGLEGEVMA